MEKKNDLCDRLLKFAVDVVLYLRTVKNTVETMDMKRRLVKSSTSSGANYEESQGSPTKPDVKTKIGISLKEMRESNYFLRMFTNLNLNIVSTPKSMNFENRHCPGPKGRLIFCDFPLGIKGKKSQDKKNGAFRSGPNSGDIEKGTYLVNESSELKKILASILNKLSILFFFLSLGLLMKGLTI